jgi:HlyD family secretion protein
MNIFIRRIIEQMLMFLGAVKRTIKTKAKSPHHTTVTMYCVVLLLTAITASCDRKKNEYDASGTFEATETIIASEANGVIKQFDIEEGQEVSVGQYIGYVDTVQLHLRKKQLESQVKTTLIQQPDIAKQLAALKVQLKAAEKEQTRFSNLLKSDAATQKQLDDVTAQVDVLRKQIEAQQSSLGITTESIGQQANPLRVQIEQVNDQLDKCRLVVPAKGVVLSKYAEVNETTVQGKPLYKIADLSTLILRAYVTGDQFSKIKLNQRVTVLVDADRDQYKNYDGTLEWISDKAEFTPKTIQTKDERANLVYAVKVRVQNDGYLKIGMYADVKF